MYMRREYLYVCQGKSCPMRSGLGVADGRFSDLVEWGNRLDLEEYALELESQAAADERRALLRFAMYGCTGYENGCDCDSCVRREDSIQRERDQMSRGNH